MKPAPFKYYAPDSVEAALELKAEHGEDAKVLAGGQSLIPAMNFRVAQQEAKRQPAHRSDDVASAGGTR